MTSPRLLCVDIQWGAKAADDTFDNLVLTLLSVSTSMRLNTCTTIVLSSVCISHLIFFIIALGFLDCCVSTLGYLTTLPCTRGLQGGFGARDNISALPLLSNVVSFAASPAERYPASSSPYDLHAISHPGKAIYCQLILTGLTCAHLPLNRRPPTLHPLRRIRDWTRRGEGGGGGEVK